MGGLKQNLRYFSRISFLLIFLRAAPPLIQLFLSLHSGQSSKLRNQLQASPEHLNKVCIIFIITYTLSPLNLQLFLLQ